MDNNLKFAKTNYWCLEGCFIISNLNMLDSWICEDIKEDNMCFT